MSHFLGHLGRQMKNGQVLSEIEEWTILQHVSVCVCVFEATSRLDSQRRAARWILPLPRSWRFGVASATSYIIP